MIRLRAARIEEAAALSELCTRSKASWGYDAAFMARSKAALQVKPAAIAAGEVVVAEEGGEPLGVAGITVEGEVAELDLLFVEPAAFGLGLGRQLLDAAIAMARKDCGWRRSRRSGGSRGRRRPRRFCHATRSRPRRFASGYGACSVAAASGRGR